MSFKKLSLFHAFIMLLAVNVYSQQRPMVMWFNHPAYQPAVFSYDAKVFTQPFFFESKGWNEALPIGNGKLGAMVFGGVFNERIQLNEESLWDGYRRDAVNPASRSALPEVQRLMFQGRNDSAQAYAAKNMLGTPLRIKPYQSLGDLFIEQQPVAGTDTLFDGYRRWLSLDSAIAVTRFRNHGISYRREVFASHPDNVIVIKFLCDKPGSINLRLKLTRQQDAVMTASPDEQNCISMKGKINLIDERTGLPAGIRFSSLVKAGLSGGSAVISPDRILTIRGASGVTLYISAATSYGGKDPEAITSEVIKKVVQQPEKIVLKKHVNDFQSLFGRVKIRLAKADPFELPQNERLDRAAKQNYEDPYLSELLFQYSRYLLISSSRSGDLPANLQGIWNQNMNPPWNSDYHTNINLQMNYMSAEAVNLRECVQPLFSLMDSIAIHGRHTAAEMYGARGWVVHHLTDIFWRTEPADGVVGIWPMGGGWLAHQLFEDYLFSGDKVFLKNRAFSLMKGAALFYIDFLKPVPSGLPMSGRLVTNPSHSPENAFETPGGSQYQFTYGATMDLEICHELFSNCLKAIALLDRPGKPFEPQFKKELVRALAGLAPLQISSKTGALQEWIEDYKEPEIGHRHISHLYGLFPGNQISAETPELFAAARKSLEKRLEGNPDAATAEASNRYKSYSSYLGGKSFGGWQSIWISMMWLRLGNGEQAYRHHLYELQHGLEANFFGHAYQLDGTFGSADVIAEMLVQSHNGMIALLPALPSRWKEGAVSGLRAQGGFTIAINWKNSRLLSGSIVSLNGSPCKLKIAGTVKIFHSGRPVSVRRNENNEIIFNTEKNGRYQITTAR